MKKIEQFEKAVNDLKLNHEDEQRVEKVSRLFNEVVYDFANNDVSPDSDDGKRLLKGQKILSGIGRKLVNLLTIEFKITFAGVTLCYLRIPKLQDTEKINKISNS